MFFVFFYFARFYVLATRDPATHEQKELMQDDLLSGRIMGLKCTGGGDTPNTNTEKRLTAPGDDPLRRTTSLTTDF